MKRRRQGFASAVGEAEVVPLWGGATRIKASYAQPIGEQNAVLLQSDER
jgi:hypothetical protein